MSSFKIFYSVCALLISNVSSAVALGERADVAGNDVRSQIRVTLLGTGTPAPSASQFGAAILVQAGEENLLFDCGRGCTTRLAQVDPALIADIDRLFLTHLHSDHVVGVDDLWLNGWLQGRKLPLEIWGPKGLKKMMRGLRAAYAADIKSRLRAGIPADDGGIAERFTEIKENGEVYSGNGVTVTAFKVEHVPGEPSFGYRIAYGGRSVAVTGDTTLTDDLFVYAEGVDLLLQEVMSPALVHYLEQTFTPPQVSEIVGIHTTAPQASALFQFTEPRLAVFYHTKSDGPSALSLMEETSQLYDGPIKVGYDLMQITIGREIVTGHVDAD